MLRYALWVMTPTGPLTERNYTVSPEIQEHIRTQCIRKLKEGKQEFWGDFRPPSYAPVRMNVRIVQDTAAILFFTPPPTPPRPCPLLASAMLLGGFADADTAALEQAAEITFDNGMRVYTPRVVEEATKGPRPLVLCVCPNPEGFRNDVVRHGVTALAEAFFGQFGVEEEDGH